MINKKLLRNRNNKKDNIDYYHPNFDIEEEEEFYDKQTKINYKDIALKFLGKNKDTKDIINIPLDLSINCIYYLKNYKLHFENDYFKKYFKYNYEIVEFLIDNDIWKIY